MWNWPLVAWTGIAVELLLFPAEAANCSYGEYQNADGVCTACTEGHFQAAPSHANSQCEACEAGTWAPIAGMSACFACPANSDSLAGASSCSYTPQNCYPCTDRSEVKIRVIAHGRVSDIFWKRMLRIMTVAGKQMNVNLVVKLGSRESLSDMVATLQDTLDEEPDAIIVTLPSASILDDVRAAAQTVPVFSFNTGNHIAKSAGSLAHFGMDEERAGYGCGEQFQSKFSAAGLGFSVCLVVYSEMDNEAMTQRSAGFETACTELGATSWAPLLVTGTNAERQASINTQVATFLSGSSSSEGLAILSLGEGSYSDILEAWTGAGNPANVKIGTFDLPDGLDEGIAAGAVAFGIDQGVFLQGFLSIVLASVYLTTGQALATELFRTGPIFVTEPRDADVALRATEGYPICNCPWVGGLEDILECGPDVDGIEPIGDCPLESCSSPCLDIRKFSVTGVLHGSEASSFWHAIKAGGEQAGHDLRLITNKIDLFKPENSGYPDSYSNELNIQSIEDTAADDSVDAVWCSVKASTYYSAVQAVAAAKPVVTFNAGYTTAETLKTDTNHLLNFVGQDEWAGGRAAGKALIAAGVTHLGCFSFVDFPVFDMRCGGAEEVFTEAGLNYTFIGTWDYGGTDWGSEAMMAGSVVNALQEYSYFNGLLSLGGGGYSWMSRGWVDSGRSLDDVVIATFDVNKNVIDLIENGDVIMGIDQQPYMQGYMSVMLLGIYHMSGNTLEDFILKTGPRVRDGPKDSDKCSLVPWTMLAEGSLTTSVVGDAFLPSHDAPLTVGFPICEREGSCKGLGSYFSTETVACEPCPAGTFANASMVTCEVCPAGTSTGGNGGSSQCYPCGRGLFTETQGTASCSYCPVGTFTSEEGMSQCEVCRAPFSTETIARETPDACMCPEGMYGTNGNYSGSGDCLPCPEGLICPFGSHEDYGTRPVIAMTFPEVEVGFMTRSENHMLPYLCLLEEWCPGGEPESCAAHRDPSKVACGTCLDGFYLADNVCSPCESTLSPTLVLTIIVGFCLVLAATLLANTGSHMRSQSNLIVLIMASLLFTNFQALSVFDNLSFEWFEPVKSILSSAGEISFSVQIVKGVCVMHLDSVTKFTLLQIGLPLSIPWCFVIVLGKKYIPVATLRRPNTDILTEVTTAVGSLMGMFFISIMMSCLAPFVCFSHPGTAGSSVRTASEILCTWEGDHLQMVITALISLILVPIPFFANACYITYQYSKNMALEARRNILHKYRFLFFRFQPQAYFYGLALVIRSLMICLVPVVIRDDAGMQIFLLAVIIICFAEFQSFLQPWRAMVCNYVDALLGVMLLSLLVCAPMAAGIETDRRPLQALGFSALLGMMVVGSVAMVMGIVKYFRRTPHFDIFLCHHKEHAAAQVRFIKTCAMNMSKCNVFIDSDNLINLDRLFDTVKNHVGLFVAYLTSHTLRRAWCCGEVVSAHSVKLQMKTIFTPTFVQPTPEQLENLDSYVRHLDETLSHYGISSVAVRIAIDALLHPATPRVVVNPTEHGGTNRFLWIAHMLLNQRSPSSFTSSKGFDVAISSPSDDDEGVAAAGFMAMKIRLFLAEFDGGGEVLCLCDHEVAGNKAPDFGEARAVVVIFSAQSLANIGQLASIVSSMEIAEAHMRNGTPFAVIPVHLPGLSFPTQQYFEADFPILWEGRSGLEKAKELLQSCFKAISVPLEISGSDTVLTAQVHSIFHRVPPSEARQNMGGSSVSLSTMRSGKSVKARGSNSSCHSSGTARTGSTSNLINSHPVEEIEDILLPANTPFVFEMKV